MHTATMIVAGLVLLAGFHFGRRWLEIRWQGSTGYITLFMITWLLISVINILVGVLSAGYPLGVELGIMVVVFGVPAAAALGIKALG